LLSPFGSPGDHSPLRWRTVMGGVLARGTLLGRSAAEDRQRTTILSEAVREEPRASTEGASTAGKIVESDGFKRDGAAHRLSPKSKEIWSAEPRRQRNRHRVMRNNKGAQQARTTQVIRPAHNPLPNTAATRRRSRLFRPYERRGSDHGETMAELRA
jgi:hypothetical protein